MFLLNPVLVYRQYTLRLPQADDGLMIVLK